MEDKIEMSFFFDYEFDYKVDGLNGRFAGQEIIHLDDYESVDRMVEIAKKVMLKKRNGEITFRCVKFKPYYDNQPMIRLVSQLWKRIITWKEGQAYGDDNEVDEWNAKMIKAICLDAIREYKNRQLEEEWKLKEREGEVAI